MERRTRRELIDRLNRDGAFLAARFGLRYRAIEAERADVTSRYGVCYDDGTIRIRLRHAVTGEPLKYSSLVSTLCHELAHLRHFNHGPRFRRFYAEILAHARQTGIYRPAPRGRAPGRPQIPTERAPQRTRRVPIRTREGARGATPGTPATRAPKPARTSRGREEAGPAQLSLFDRPPLSRQPSWES